MIKFTVIKRNPGKVQKHIQKLIHLALFGLITISCHRKNILDHRHKYIGSWQFTITENYHQWTQNSNGTWNVATSSGTGTYDGSVEYGTGDDDLLITYGNNQSVNTSEYKADSRKKMTLSFSKSYPGTNSNSDFNLSGVKN